MASFYDQNILLDVPSAYYRLDETSGVLATDLSGNSLTSNYAGTFTLNSSFLAGDGGKGVLLNGVDGYLWQAGNATLGAIAATWTLEAWVQLTASTTTCGIISQPFVSSVPWEMGINTTANAAANLPQAPFFNGAFAYNTSFTALATGTPYHIAATWNGTRLCIYVNGVLKDSSTPTIAPVTQGNQQVFFGKDRDSLHFLGGKLARVAIYSTALSEVAVRRHYNAIANAPATGGANCDTEYVAASSTTSIKIIGNGTAWTNGTSPFTASSGSIGSQTVDATKQIVTISYTAAAIAGFVTFTDGTATVMLHVTGTPTGIIVAQGDLVSLNDTFNHLGPNATALIDASLSVHWAAPTASTGYAGWDLGSGIAFIPSGIRLAPRPSVFNDASAYEEAMWGVIVKGSNVSPISTLTTIRTFAKTDFLFARNRLRAMTLSGSTGYRYLILASATNGYGQIGEMEFTGAYVTGMRSKPVEPTITPSGFRRKDSTAVSVTFTTTTTTPTALCLYTTDGTTPAQLYGIPTGTTRVGFSTSIIPTVAGVTVKAMIYDPTCTTTDSLVVTSAPFKVQSIAANVRVYNITDGNTVEAHSGHVFKWGSYWYRIGHFSDIDNIGDFQIKSGGLWMYRSTDLANWQVVGQFAQDENVLYGFVRPHHTYRVSTAKHVIIARAVIDGGFADRAGIWTADNVEGPYTLYSAGADMSVDIAFMQDCSLFENADGITTNDTYLIAVADVSHPTTGYRMQKLAADGLSCTGAFVDIASTPTREAPTLTKFVVGGVTTFAIIGSEARAYSSLLSFDARYILGTGGTTPLNCSWGAAPGTLLFGTDQLGTDYNAQPTCIIEDVPGVGKVLAMDNWNAATAVYNYLANDVWVPISLVGSAIVSSKTPWALVNGGVSSSRIRGGSIEFGISDDRANWRSR